MKKGDLQRYEGKVIHLAHKWQDMDLWVHDTMNFSRFLPFDSTTAIFMI